MQLHDGEDLAKQSDGRPPMSAYTYEVEVLQDIANQMRLLRIEQISGKGGRPGKPHLLKPPRTAFDTIEMMKREQEHRTLVGRLLPHKKG